MAEFPLPTGVTERQLRLIDGDGPDVDRAWRVADRHERALLGTAESTREEVRSLLAGPDSPPDGQLLLERDGEPVGFVSLEVDHDRREVFLDAYADPADRDSPAVLRALVAAGAAYARRVATDHPAPARPAHVQPAQSLSEPSIPAPNDDAFLPNRDIWQALAGGFVEDQTYAEALSANGFRAIRRHWQMYLDLDAAGLTAEDPAAPQGITRIVATTDEQLRDLHAVYADSFRDHFGAGPMAYDPWLVAIRALPGADPQRWWLAMDGDTPVGLCLVDDSRAEFGDSYVRTLGVARAARGRGIARWLLGCAFADAVRRGRTGVALTVDSASPTGATRLYEGVGMTRRRVIDAWCLPV